MSARRLRNTDGFQPVTVRDQATCLSLPAHAVRFRRNGIEFLSRTAFAPWTEMTVEWATSAGSAKFRSAGVVVHCARRPGEGRGYQVTMLFTRLSRQAQARLQALAHSALAPRPPAA